MVAEPVTGAPVVDRLDTRAIESRRLRKGYVRSLQLAHSGLRDVRFVTSDRRVGTWTDWGDHEPQPDEVSEGELRIDVISDDVLRVRYTPADADPTTERAAAHAAMVVSTLPEPTTVLIAHGDGETTLATPSMRATIRWKPFELRIADPSGRERFRSGGREKNSWGLWDTFNTGVSRLLDGGRPLATECYALRPGEGVYGFGEKFLRLQTTGQTVDLNMVEATGTTTPRSYKNIPFFWTTAGYGVFWATTARATAWVGSRGAADIQVAIEDDVLDQYVFVGAPKTILDRYTALTGRAPMPPRWSFGWWQSKISYRAADEVTRVVARHRDAGLPMDVVHLDTHWFREDWRNDLEFDPDRFPDPAAFLRELREQGVHVCLWQLPYIPEGSALFDELHAAGAFVRAPDGGDLYDVRICYTPGFQGRVGIVDFTNPEAVRIYGGHIRRLLDLGASCIKVDFGEQAPLDGVYHDGTPGSLAHNLYPLLYNRAIAEATHDATGDWLIWARSAWSGSQRYPVHWGGDSSPNWDNLGPQLAGGLSLGCSGFSFWSHDIGGFVGPTGGDLLVRWLQAGLFCSHARIHGVGTRELVDHGDDVLELGRAALELRYRLLPSLLGEARRGAAAGLPFMRALVIEFPDDPTVWNIDDQWLVGEHLLVAPILEPSGRRRVYLPAGRWADWWTREVVDGPQWREVDAPIDRIPLWVREGGVIALGPASQFVGEVPTEHLVLRALRPGAGREDAQGELDVDGRRAPWFWSDGVPILETPPGVTTEIDWLG